MTIEQINKLISEGDFPEKSGGRILIETHISWVILCDEFVYKIKKPVQYSFLDFSTPELRKYYCEREIELNRRLTPGVYTGVVSIREWQDKMVMEGRNGIVIDHAVKMHRLDIEKQMDKLLARNLVTEADMKELAEKVASFHKQTEIIYQKDLRDIQEKFNDLKVERDYLSEHLGSAYGVIIDKAMEFSNRFLHKNEQLIAGRLGDGFYRDCHGDLHSKNIFLLPEPLPFDCIEFNDDFRQIDVLNEVAFLCMDLDAYDRSDLSEAFLSYYNEFFPAMKSIEEESLFIYYKSYRANIRAKVNSLRARSATTDAEKVKALDTAKQYLILMKNYIGSLIR